MCYVPAPQSAFPDNYHSPASICKCGDTFGITQDIRIEFQLPFFDICSRRAGESTVRMTMPEASVHENRNPVSRENDIRAGWKLAVMQGRTQDSEKIGR
jgi:hypothetical protein